MKIEMCGIVTATLLVLNILVIVAVVGGYYVPAPACNQDNYQPSPGYTPEKYKRWTHWYEQQVPVV